MMRSQVIYIGAATVRFEIGALRFLTDPAHDPAGSHSGAKLMGPAIPPNEIGAIDAVLLSHDQHGDNLDEAGRALLPTAGQVLTTKAGATRLGGNAVGLDPWQHAEIKAANDQMIRVTATPARHGPPGAEAALGDVIGFILEWPAQERGALYISGDTTWHEGVEQVKDRFDVGTAILHLGAVSMGSASTTLITFDAAGAARAALALHAHTVIPVHFEGWTHFRESRHEIEQAFEQAGITDRVRWPPAGEAIQLNL